jgi:parallel beta-helix repeat protein
MAVIYVDLVSGDDTTGDGTAGTPYKTLNKADGIVNGPHDIRVAKTTAAATVGAATTFGWANNSVSVSTSTDLTGVLATGNYIGKPTATGNGAVETFYRIASITSTTITLVNRYYGTTGNTTGALQITPVTTGPAAGNAMTVTVAGHTVSGGWNLAGSPTQDGETWVKSNNANWATTVKYFFSNTTYAITVSKFNVIEQQIVFNCTTGAINCSYCTFYTYNYINVSTSNASIPTFDHCFCLSGNSYSLLIYTTTASITNCVFIVPVSGASIAGILINIAGSAYTAGIVLTNNYMVNCVRGLNILTPGISLVSCSGNVIDNCTTPIEITGTNNDTVISGFAISNTTVGIDFGINTFQNAVIQNCTFTSCSTAGIKGRCKGWNIENCTFTNCGYGIYLTDSYSFNVKIMGCTFTTPTTYAIYHPGATTVSVVDCTIDAPSIAKAYNIVSGTNNIEPLYIFKNSFGLPDGLYYPFGSLITDTTVHTSAPSMKFTYDATNQTNYTTRFPVVKFYTPNATGRQLSIWIKTSNAGWTGTIIPEWRLNGKLIKTEDSITQATPLDTTWRQFTWSCANNLVTTDGVLAMVFQIRSTNHSLYWDDVLLEAV